MNIKIINSLSIIFIITLVWNCSSENEPTSSTPPPPPPGIVINVPGDYSTIKEAASVAGVNDTIIVACGIYNEHDILLSAGVVLSSETQQSGCVTIEANLATRCIRLMGENYPIKIVGFTFKGGNASGGEYPDNVGAGLFSEGETPLILENCLFEENTAEEKGGAIYWGGEGSNITVRNCSFIGTTNYLDRGGLIYIRGGSSTFNDCEFSDGNATSGGAIYLNGNSGFFNDCYFNNNSARHRGGGLYCGVSGELKFNNCHWQNNRGGFVVVGGGGNALWIESSNNITLENCSFQDNSGYGKGGAIYSYPNLTLRYCVLARNIISRFSSSYPADGGALYSGQGARLENCTIVENSASSGLGSGIYCLPSLSDSLTVDRCIIVGSPEGTSVYCAEGISLRFSCTDIWGNSDGNWVGRIEEQRFINGNFSADPLFSNIYYNLTTGSPCAPTNNVCGVLIGAMPVL